MLVKVTATVEAMVYVDTANIIQADAIARERARADCFEILREDLANSSADQIPIATTLITHRQDIPFGFKGTIPWCMPYDEEALNERSCLDLFVKSPNQSLRPIEVAIAKDDGTWYDSVFIDIPNDTPEDQINSVAEKVARSHPCCQGEGISHVWVCNTMEDSRPEST